MDDSIQRPTFARTQDVPPMVRETTDILISLDTEYHACPQLELPQLGISGYPLSGLEVKKNRQHNAILSYQYLALNAQTGQVVRDIYYPKQGERLSQGNVILKAADGLNIPRASLRPQTKRQRPLRIMFAWHWGSAEVGALADRKKLMSYEEVKDIGGSVITLRPFLYRFDLEDASHHYGQVEVVFRDTAKLMDAQCKLADLGRELGIPKVDIDPWTKDRMDTLLKENPELFERYAFTDVEIVLAWICDRARTQREVLHMDELAPTTGAASASGLKVFLGEQFQEKFSVRFSHAKQEWTPTGLRAFYESFPTQCFLGAMNQSYRLGRAKGLILDLDLSGAYAGALGVLPGIKWEEAPLCDIRNPWDLTDLMCFAAVTFEFPPAVEFPCLPVGTSHGLIYPLASGDRQPVGVTGPEIQEALLLGAKIRVHAAQRYATDSLLTAGYVHSLAAVRAQFPKGDARNLEAKLAINALYGKMGQGLTNRYTNEEIFSSNEIEESKKMRRSPVTLPHAAATITGMIRAVLNVLVNEASKLGTVLSATTDGIMMCLPAETDKASVLADLMQTCSKHPSVQLLMKGRVNLGLSPDDWLEDKHPGGTVACTLKTRTNWIGNNAGTVHEARVGFEKDREHPAYVPFEVLESIARDRQTAYYNETRLNKISDVMEGRAKDVTAYTTSKRVNVAPDWKRHFAPDGTSVPFKSMAEYWRYRRVVDAQGADAWPDLVEYLVARRYTSKSMLVQAIRRDVLHRIATGVPGFRLPKGTTHKDACRLVGVHEKALARLRKERRLQADLPIDHPEVIRIKHLLGLW